MVRGVCLTEVNERGVKHGGWACDGLKVHMGWIGGFVWSGFGFGK